MARDRDEQRAAAGVLPPDSLRAPLQTSPRLPEFPAATGSVDASVAASAEKGLAPFSRPTRALPPDRSRQQNVIPQNVDRSHRDDTLTQDTHWQGDVLVEGAVIVPPHITLTIAPGTTVHFRSSSGSLPSPGVLLVEGRLVVSGTADRPVSLLPATAPALPRDWQGIVLLGSDKRNIIEQCRIEGATTALDLIHSAITLNDVSISSADTGLHLQDSLVTVRGGIIAGCLVGCDLTASELEMKSVRLMDNRAGILAWSSSLLLADSDISGNDRFGLAAEDCRISIRKSSVSGNGGGIYLAGGEGAVSGCRIGQNRQNGIHLAGARIKITGNDIDRNGRSGLAAEDGGAGIWGNAFRGNTLHDLEYRGTEDLRAMYNWWQPREAGASPAISDGSVNGRGKVLTLPQLKHRPALSGQP